MRTHRSLSVIAGLLSFCAVLVSHSPVSADIQRAGDHVHYGAEIEPHLVLQWANERGYDEGFGFGARASIVLIDNGPLPMLNNTLAVSFGLDLTFFDDDLYGTLDRDAVQIWLPVAAQWNFYFTSEFAMFPEFGLAIRYWKGEVACIGNQGACDDDKVDIEPVFWVGGRYTFSDTMAFTFRLGHPSINIGISMFL